MTGLVSEREFDFLMNEFLDTQGLVRRSFYSEHTGDVFAAALGAARRLALEIFAPRNAKGDQCQSDFRNGAARVISETGHVAVAWMWARMAAIALQRQNESDDPLYRVKLSTASFYFERLLPETQSLAVVLGADSSPWTSGDGWQL
ncbi:hypothetical protein C7T35_33605 [Variovorax sp. WS11]|uniref:acyl-CoA dehydrogenase C-terminal domain-containing protein n=1 Tax=Variovorax sp. WS11 TaxID=1105204 RepID=UPI000D0E2543|nr:acyl-CoA dehydrogenase C-terminal domain-containing protein [Variovorax sp. WS11]NDZ17759.1 hypothetical protein [Variovorax sp. WS11]PSL80199.1 hypothetical protein C7T35_33605 [Variovorax sp. WS11]